MTQADVERDLEITRSAVDRVRATLEGRFIGQREVVEPTLSREEQERLRALGYN